MKIQVLNLSCVVLAGILWIATLNDAHAIQRRTVETKPDGECMLSRRYLDEKKVMRFFSNDMLVKEAGSSKKSCSKYCQQAAKYIPEAHVSKLKNAVTVEYKCRYNSHIHEKRQFEPVFNADTAVKKLTLLKKPKKKKASVSSYIHKKGRPAVVPPEKNSSTVAVPQANADTSPAPQENPYAIQQHYYNDAKGAKASVDDYRNPRRKTKDY